MSARSFSRFARSLTTSVCIARAWSSKPVLASARRCAESSSITTDTSLPSDCWADAAAGAACGACFTFFAEKWFCAAVSTLLRVASTKSRLAFSRSEDWSTSTSEAPCFIPSSFTACVAAYTLMPSTAPCTFVRPRPLWREL